jgi:hypothetical protein
MLAYFLLLMHGAGARWAPLAAIPLLVAGFGASVWLMVSGIRGLLSARSPADRGLSLSEARRSADVNFMIDFKRRPPAATGLPRINRPLGRNYMSTDV